MVTIRSSIVVFILVLSASPVLFAQDLADTVMVNQLMKEGVELLSKGQYQRSAQKYDSAVNLARKNRIWAKAFKSENQIIQCLWRQGKLSEAQVQSVQLLQDIWSKLGKNTIHEATVFQNLGTVKLYEGKYDSAILNYEKSILINENLGEKDLNGLAVCYNNIGVCHLQIQDLNKATDFFERALFYDKKLYGEDHFFVGQDLENIGIIYERRNLLDEAEEYLLKAKELFPEDVLLYPKVINNLAIVNRKKGKIRKAIEMSKRALSLSQKISGFNFPENKKYLTSIGDSFSAVEKHDSASFYYGKVIELYHLSRINAVDVLDYTIVINQKAVGEANLGNYRSALETVDEAEKFIELQLDDRYEDLFAFLTASKGYIYHQAKNYENSVKEYEKAIKYFQENKALYPDWKIWIFEESAKSYAKLNLFDDALHSLQTSIKLNAESWTAKDLYDVPSFEKVKNKWRLFFSLRTEIEILIYKYDFTDQFEDLGRLNQLFDYFNEFVQLTRGSFNDFDEKQTFQSRVLDVYQTAIEYNFRAYEKTNEIKYLEKCFKFSESSKSVLLSDILDTESARKWSRLPEELIKKERGYQADIAYYQTLVNSEKEKEGEQDEEKVDLFQDRIFNLKSSLDSLLKVVEEKYPRYFEIKYGNLAISLDKVQQDLALQETLIEYSLGDSAGFAFIISKNQFDVVEIDRLGTLDSLISSFRSQVEDFKSKDQLNDLSYRLYQKLLGPVAEKVDLSNKTKLIIVPDASVGYIPFELLLSSPIRNGDENHPDLPYLLKKFQISYGYSASLLFREQRAAKKSNVDYLSFAPSYELASDAENAVRSAELGRFRDAFVSLEWNQQEAAKLDQYLSGQTQLGANATERSFKENARNAKILHLAMHAFVDDEEPMNSKLVFYQDNDSIEDGYLHTFELFNMNLNADLAVLSACQTGYGKLVKGEGIMSLARGFAYAGVPSVVMSHWQVDDQSTSQLMQYFYQFLSKGQTKSQALRQAKLKYLSEASPNKQHPFFWGAFVVVGDDSPIETDSYSWIYFLLGGIAVLITGWFLLGRLRQRKTV